MERIRSFIGMLWLGIGMGILLPTIVFAQGNIPTWYVGDTWDYSESGTYTLTSPDSQVNLTETLTYQVTAVTDNEYIVTKTSRSVEGTFRYGRYTFTFCNAYDRGTLRVRRSNLKVVSEQRIINTGLRAGVCINDRLHADLTLTNIGIGPSLYDFPLADGSMFSFDPAVHLEGIVSYHIPGESKPHVTTFDAMPDAPLLTTVSQDGGAFAIKAAFLNTPGPVGFTDFFDAGVKTYNKQILAADIPDTVIANYTRTLTASNLVTPASRITLNIVGPTGDATAKINEIVILSGTVTPAPPAGTVVTLRQPEFSANWTTTTDATGNYTLSVAVPNNFTDDVTRGSSNVVANPGILASAGDAYTVSVLTVFPLEVP